jgi:homoserine O-acetyltransferase
MCYHRECPTPPGATQGARGSPFHEKLEEEMRPFTFAAHAFGVVALVSVHGVASAADYPDPVTDSYVIENFTFHTGEVMPEMRVSYTTVGDPSGEPVLMLHGTTGSANSMLREGFADALYGPGQPLDATRYFIIIPDAIGTGDSSKPSDGLRAAFPEYNYVDMVNAQYALLTDHLGIDHLRLVMGNSMGGMLTWTWGIEYPDFMDALVPMASLPGPMSGRNWMMRRMLIDSVRNDPAWNNGDYTDQPPALRLANVWFSVATSNGEKRLARIGNTREAADAYLDQRLAEGTAPDANDAMYQWNASRDFDPTPDLDKIEAALLVINSEDDERNPPELDTLAKGMEAIGHGEVYIIPATDETSGHGTTGSMAALYAEPLARFLETAPKR